MFVFSDTRWTGGALFSQKWVSVSRCSIVGTFSFYFILFYFLFNLFLCNCLFSLVWFPRKLGFFLFFFYPIVRLFWFPKKCFLKMTWLSHMFVLGCFWWCCDQWWWKISDFYFLSFSQQHGREFYIYFTFRWLLFWHELYCFDINSE